MNLPISNLALELPNVLPGQLPLRHGGLVQVGKSEEGKSVPSVWWWTFDVNINKFSVSPKYSFHFIVRDVQLKVANEKGSGGKWIVLRHQMVQVVRKLVLLILSSWRPLSIRSSIAFIKSTTITSGRSSWRTSPPSPVISEIPPSWRSSEIISASSRRRSSSVPVISISIWCSRSSIIHSPTPTISWRGHAVGPANISSTLILLPTGRLVHSLHHGRLVKKDDPAFRMLGISCVLKISEVDIGNSLVWLMHHSHRDVTVLLVLPVQRVPHYVVTGFQVQGGNTEHFVSSSLGWRAPTSSIRRAPPSPEPWRSAPVTHWMIEHCSIFALITLDPSLNCTGPHYSQSKIKPKFLEMFGVSFL